MEIFDTTQLGLERALSGAAARQSVLAENLANVSTPGYRRKDVDFHATLQAAFATGRDAVEAAAAVSQTDPTASARQDGNSVDADAENAALARNGLEYEALSSLIKARSDVLRAAIGIG